MNRLTQTLRNGISLRSSANIDATKRPDQVRSCQRAAAHTCVPITNLVSNLKVIYNQNLLSGHILRHVLPGFLLSGDRLDYHRYRLAELEVVLQDQDVNPLQRATVAPLQDIQVLSLEHQQLLET